MRRASKASKPYVPSLSGKLAIKAYFGAVLSGDIVACEKIKKVARIVLDELEHGSKDGRFSYDERYASKHINFIERFCRLPSGRLGAPFRLELFQRAILAVIFGFVDSEGVRQYQEVLWIMGRKNGKALSLDTPIPTPDGWRTMRDVRVGDFVFDVDGKQTRVVYKSPVFTGHECFKVTFDDGETIVADAEHIWRVHDRHGRIKDRTTAELAGFSLNRVRCDGKGREYPYRVPIGSPVEYGHKDLPIDPYTFGVWLGDGRSDGCKVTCSDDDLPEMMEHVEDAGHTCRRYHNENRCGGFTIDVNRNGWHKNPFIDALHDLGVYGNKHIPRIYLESSVEQRRELLRGLMDTDGYCSKSGECQFVQKQNGIVDGFDELLSSLAIRHTVKHVRKTCNGNSFDCVSVQFYVDKAHSCFKLARKHGRLKDSLCKRSYFKSIVSVDSVDSVETQCIAVESGTHLYRAGRTMTVTHNTAIASGIELDMTANDGEGAPEVYNVATARDQAAKGFDNCQRMVKTSPQLAKHIRKRVNDLYCDLNMGIIRALSANTNHLDGFDISCAIIDELAAMKNRDLYDLVIQGISARRQPLVLQITTNGFVRGGIFDAQYEYASKWLDGKAEGEKADRFIAFIYELDEREEWQDEDCWIKANPGLGTIKSIDKLRANVSKAKDDPTFLPTLLVKDFNLVENQSTAWLNWSEIHNDATFDIDELGIKYWICGVDASDTTDLTAACLLGMRPGDSNIYALHMAWIPERSLQMAEQEGRRGGKDGVPYDMWIARGLMKTDPNPIIDKRVVLDWLEDLRREHGIYAIACGYDPWHMRDAPTVDAYTGYFGRDNFIKVIQGAQTLSMPMKEIKALYKENRIVDNSNPIAEWCRSNVMVRTDANGNIAPDKKNSDPRNRIDAWAAEIDAFVTLREQMDNYRALIGG